MSKGEAPDLSLIEADIRNVATVMELTEELRKMRLRLEAIVDTQHELILIGDRIAPIERMVREIALGMGIRL